MGQPNRYSFTLSASSLERLDGAPNGEDHNRSLKRIGDRLPDEVRDVLAHYNPGVWLNCDARRSALPQKLARVKRCRDPSKKNPDGQISEGHAAFAKFLDSDDQHSRDADDNPSEKAYGERHENRATEPRWAKCHSEHHDDQGDVYRQECFFYSLPRVNHSRKFPEPTGLDGQGFRFNLRFYDGPPLIVARLYAA